jgi:deoxyribodipyrimidine photo-lyase
MPRRAICWIRRDLRLSDHAALTRATDLADEVAVVFVFDKNILDVLEDSDDRRVNFIHKSLEEVDAGLRQYGSALVVRHGDPIDEIPHVAEEFGADLVVTARDYEPYARERDAAVEAHLRSRDIEFESVRDSHVLDPWMVQSQAGTPFRVYTPFARAWRLVFDSSNHAAEHTPNPEKFAINPSGLGQPWSMETLGFTSNDLWTEAGESGAKQKLAEFRPKLSSYGERRDFPADDFTSALSVHFRFGTVSIREAVRVALEENSAGANKWFAELIWREFYQHILWHWPQVTTETFNPLYKDIQYPGTDEHWQAWVEGKTGYPLVDAAMRCVNTTGWMHNRLRMVVASFLTKDLLIDYRRGEAYFARYLLDFDLASNNGGWQWAASVGADAQPYFRIFNPKLQSQKFDPEGTFIRHWLPELAALPTQELHEPSPFTLLEQGIDYPQRIVDHHVQKDLAIRLLERPKAYT